MSCSKIGPNSRSGITSSHFLYLSKLRTSCRSRSQNCCVCKKRTHSRSFCTRRKSIVCIRFCYHVILWSAPGYLHPQALAGHIRHSSRHKQTTSVQTRITIVRITGLIIAAFSILDMCSDIDQCAVQNIKLVVYRRHHPDLRCYVPALRYSWHLDSRTVLRLGHDSDSVAGNVFLHYE